ncbi:uracil-DNA glycosylase domain protein [Bacteriovorax sp. BAL6_X]|uniref:uracil-DNA glycosylase n=1 Tax=Bacteriovorax sp. BAL6_X TaxID=1201290 RepID=UPI000385B5D0|nr:uracil-DNA glycosylase [Bacteriovorax sp. BAL6_X]EPZ49426.1 uracil-DNA glycosylase domain protein [Bacteriovorax sp. BAL6_X]
MAQFLTKLTKDFNNVLKLTRDEKPNYYAKLFENTLWYPKLKERKLTSSKASQEVTVAFKQASKPTVVVPQQEAASVEQTVLAPKIEVPITPPKRKIDIAAASSTVESSRTIKVNNDINKFLSQYSTSWDLESIPGFKDYQGEVDIIFFGLDEIEEGELPDFLPLSMIESDQDIMGRMIKAMKISSGRFIRVPFIKKDAREFLFTCCAHFKPRLLISLGAAATNLCLDKRVRLANVHGEFHSIQIEVDGNAQLIDVMPLFHPKLLEVNESMKKTAWTDMQKAIKFLSS